MKANAHQASQTSYHAIAFTSQPAHQAITFSSQGDQPCFESCKASCAFLRGNGSKIMHTFQLQSSMAQALIESMLIPTLVGAALLLYLSLAWASLGKHPKRIKLQAALKIRGHRFARRRRGKRRSAQRCGPTWARVFVFWVALVVLATCVVTWRAGPTDSVRVGEAAHPGPATQSIAVQAYDNWVARM